MQAALFLWLTGRFTASVRAGRRSSSRTRSRAICRTRSASIRSSTSSRTSGTSSTTSRSHSPWSCATAGARRIGLGGCRRDLANDSVRPRRPPPGELGGRGDGPPAPPRDRIEPRIETMTPGGPGAPIAPPPGDRPGPGGPDGFGRRRGGGRGGPFPNISPIVVSNVQVGHVAVPSGPPPMEIVLRELGPTLTWSGLALLGIGAMIVGTGHLPSGAQAAAIARSRRTRARRRTHGRARGRARRRRGQRARAHVQSDGGRARVARRPRSPRPIARAVSCSPTCRTS